MKITTIEKVVLGAIIVLVIGMAVGLSLVCSELHEASKKGSLTDQAAEEIGSFIGKVQKAADDAAGEDAEK